MRGSPLGFLLFGGAVDEEEEGVAVLVGWACGEWLLMMEIWGEWKWGRRRKRRGRRAGVLPLV